MKKRVLSESINSQYTDDQRREAVATWMINGSIKHTAKQLNIPQTTLHYWSKTEWWDSLCESMREERNKELDAQLSRVIHSALEQVQDRIDNGEEVILKDGSRARKAIAGRDAAVITGVMFDKRQLLRNMPTKINATNTDERLAMLANKIRTLEAGTTTIEGDRLDKPQDKKRSPN